MANDLCSAYQCNVCLLLSNENAQENLNQYIGSIKASNEVNKLLVKNALNTATKDAKLLKCNGCHLVVYCGAAHQRLDWKLHRVFCRAITNILQRLQLKHPLLLSGGNIQNREHFQQTKLQLKLLLHEQLERPLTYYENELISFPRCCEVCFKFNNVQYCQKCQLAVYCGSEHQAQDAMQHQHKCALLKLIYCAYKVHFSEAAEHAELLESPTNLKHTNLSKVFERITQRQLPLDATASLQDYKLFGMASNFSCIATICYALQEMQQRSLLLLLDHIFVLHVVGATFEPYQSFQELHVRFFFAQFPEVQQLELYFIGPEVYLDGNVATTKTYQIQCVKRSVNYTSKRSLYQTFMRHNSNLKKPTMIAAFNCGFSEYTKDLHAQAATTELDTWQQGIEQLLRTYDTPIIFTSFTALEAQFDYEKLQAVASNIVEGVHVQTVIDSCVNPYRELRPNRNCYYYDNEDIFYRNGHLQAIITQPKVSKS